MEYLSGYLVSEFKSDIIDFIANQSYEVQKKYMDNCDVNYFTELIEFIKFNDDETVVTALSSCTEISKYIYKTIEANTIKNNCTIKLTSDIIMIELDARTKPTTIEKKYKRKIDNYIVRVFAVDDMTYAVVSNKTYNTILNIMDYTDLYYISDEDKAILSL